MGTSIITGGRQGIPPAEPKGLSAAVFDLVGRHFLGVLGTTGERRPLRSGSNHRPTWIGRPLKNPKKF